MSVEMTYDSLGSDGLSEIVNLALERLREQPFDFDHPIMKAPHTVLSAHAAYWSEESGRELRERAMQAAIEAVQGRVPIDCLNPCVFDSSAR